MARRKAPCIPDQPPADANPRTAFDPNGPLEGPKNAFAKRMPNTVLLHGPGE